MEIDFKNKIDEINKFNQDQENQHKTTPDPEEDKKEINSPDFNIDDITSEEERPKPLEFDEETENDQEFSFEEKEEENNKNDELDFKKNQLWAQTIVNSSDMLIAKIGCFATGNHSDENYAKYSAPTRERKMIYDPLAEVLMLMKKPKNPYQALFITCAMVYFPIILKIIMDGLKNYKEKKKAKQQKNVKVVPIKAVNYKEKKNEYEKAQEPLKENFKTETINPEKPKEEEKPKTDQPKKRGRKKGTKVINGKVVKPQK